MPADLDRFFRMDFGTRAAIFAVSVFIIPLPFCMYKKQWPDIGSLTVMTRGAAGTSSGIRITVLTVWLPLVQLGPLGDDKPALVLGGLVAFVVSCERQVSTGEK